MSFEKFARATRSYIPKASIWSRGQIGFSMGAVIKFDLGKYKYVMFHFDPENRKIGFQFTSDENEKGIVKLNIRKTGGLAGGKAFLDYYEIDYKVNRQYTLRYDEENKLYVIDLNEHKND